MSKKHVFIVSVLLIAAIISGALYWNSFASSRSIAADTLSATAFINSMNYGWNLGDSFDSKSNSNLRGTDGNLGQEAAWGNPVVTKELIHAVKNSGFNTIRIPITWYYNTYEDADGNLCINTAWLDRIAEVVDYCLEEGLYVIINTHHDDVLFYTGVSDSEFNTVLNNASQLWTQIADYFKDYDLHLIFEAYNEVDNKSNSFNYGDTAAAQMNQLNQVFVNAVRSTGSNNLDRILIVPTLLNGNSSIYLNSFTLPKDTAKNKLLVAVHTYTKSYSQDVEPLFQTLENFSQKISAPVIITEFGTTTEYSPAEMRTNHASNFISRAKAHGIKCIWWDNGYEYKIIDRYTLKATDNGIISALKSGYNGTAYVSNSMQKFTSIDSFDLKMPNLGSGIIESAYWGTITTNTKIQISENASECILTLFSDGDATDIWLQRLLFYDSNGNYIKGYEIQAWNFTADIPDGAAYYIVSMNSPYRNISKETYAGYFSSGSLILYATTYNQSDISEIHY